MPTETVYIRKKNREKLREAEDKTGLSMARLINLYVENGHLDEVIAEHSRQISPKKLAAPGGLRRAF